ncbi:MAG: anti-sigma regulatory factor [Armatimonadetes bacterium]|nr:anti-sigma regulatory factor [Armatimonadota bacterium]
MTLDASVLDILQETDIVAARSRGKELARAMGFGMVDQTRIATGISELARNILQYARKGRIQLRSLSESGRAGLEIVAEDEGPGIPHINAVLDGTARSPRGLGLGILGTRRLMDEFEVRTEAGQGTRVRCVKWL